MNEPRAYEPNPILSWAYKRLFENIDVDPAWVEAIRECDKRGTVVYALRNLSFIDFLALDHLTKRFGLPQVKFAQHLGLGVLEPFGKGWFQTFSRKTPRGEESDLTTAIQADGSAILFLKRPPGLLEPKLRGLPEGERYLRILMELQRKQTRPIYIVPQAFIWTRGSDSLPSPVDALIGPREWPGRIRSLVQLATSFDHVIFRAGEALDLKEYLAAQASEPLPADEPDIEERRLASVLLRRIERERRGVIGPVRKSRERMREYVLRSPRLKQVIRDLSGENVHERHVIEWRAESMLRELETDLDMNAVGAFGTAISAIFTRIFSGLHVDIEGLERLREHMKTHSVLFLPSHKSHFDYLVLSYALFTHNLQVPVIAAGDNLNFFPLGALFRKSGAFFIRRSFRGDRLYGAVVEAYMRRLLIDGWSMEFFLEGGRSRTGKTLPPKLGLLSMVVNAVLESEKPAIFQPVSITYERIVEENSYSRELRGGDKRRENLQSLLSSASLLTSRYGTVSLQFGAPIVLSDFEEATTARTSPPKRRAMIQSIAAMTMREINKVTTVSAAAVVAMVLLTHEGRGLSFADLLARANTVAGHLEREGARFAPGLLEDALKLNEAKVRAALWLYVSAGHVKLQVPGRTIHSAEERKAAWVNAEAYFSTHDEARLYLDFARNSILHFFFDRGVFAAALLYDRRRIESGVERAILAERVGFLHRLLRLEFPSQITPTPKPADEEHRFDADLKKLVSYGLLEEGTKGEVRLVDARDLLAYLAVRPVIESYRIAARALPSMPKSLFTAKEFSKRALSLGESAFISGDLLAKEAISRTTFENAAEIFVDLGVLGRDEGKYALTPTYANPDVLRTLEDKITPYIRRASR